MLCWISIGQIPVTCYCVHRHRRATRPSHISFYYYYRIRVLAIYFFFHILFVRKTIFCFRILSIERTTQQVSTVQLTKQTNTDRPATIKNCNLLIRMVNFMHFMASDGATFTTHMIYFCINLFLVSICIGMWVWWSHRNNNKKNGHQHMQNSCIVCGLRCARLSHAASQQRAALTHTVHTNAQWMA